jgi:ABC-type lipoprotein export system ATPase subunit
MTGAQANRKPAKELVLDSVSKAYGSHQVLDGVSLEVRSGDFIAVVGPSGSGKTTLLGIMGGLEKPSSGSVAFQGEDLASFDDNKLAEYRNRSVGFVHQTFNLLPFLSARENVMVPMIVGGRSTSWASTRSLELLEFVQLEDKARMLPRQLSGGEQQRVAVARALSNEPEIVLADEPTANLDEKNEKVVVDYLARLVDGGKAVVLCTHHAGLARLASRTYSIDEGVLSGI